ncbi:MAG: hypothetical protein COT00_02115, partial [Candidatus Omnitrophica bacterium CG07_land_8_20_14_0_80_50_8]
MKKKAKEENDNKAGGVNAAQLATLRAKAEKLQAVEKELREARNYFASYMKDADAKYKALAQANETLQSDTQNKTVGKQEAPELDQALAKLKSQNDQLLTAQTQQTDTIENLKTQNKKIVEENKTLENELESARSEIKNQAEPNQELEKLKKSQAQQTKTIQGLEAKNNKILEDN